MSEFHRFTKKQIEALANLESSWLLADKVYVETIEKKNELESSIYNWQDRMEGNLKAFFDPESIKNLTAALAQAREWLDSVEGTEVSKSQYVEKLNAIYKVTDVVVNREKQYEELPPAI